MIFQLPFWQNKISRAFILTAILVAGLSLILVQVPLHDSLLTLGFTFDFLFTVPLVYLLLIRNTAVPAITVVPLSVLMLLLAGWLLPHHHHQYLDLYRQFALPLLELVVVAIIFYKIRKAGLAVKAAGAETDMYYRLQQAAREVFLVPAGAAAVMATEVGMFYYAVAAFRKPKEKQGFGYHRETGLMAIVGAFAMLIVVETIAVHFLLMLWSAWAAYVLSFLSLYSLVYILALAGAAKHRQHEFLPEGLMLRFGLQETLVPYEQVVSLNKLKGEVPEEKAMVKLGLLDNFNLVMRVKDPQLLNSFYGIRRKYKTLVFWADDSQSFIEAFQAKQAESL